MSKIQQLSLWVANAIEHDQQINADEIVPTCDDYNRAFAVIELTHALMPALIEAVARLHAMQHVCCELSSFNPFIDDEFDRNKAVLEKLK